MPILLDMEYAADHEVAMFACLEPGTGRAVLLGTMVANFQEDGDFEIPEDEVACIRNVLTGMDAAAVVAAMAQDAEDPLPAGEFMAGFFRCIPKGWVSAVAAPDTPEAFEERVDCARDALAGLDAEIMVALMRDEETREAEGFISALMDCTYFLEELVGILDDHPDRIADATVVEAGDTLLAPPWSTTTTWTSSPSWRRKGPSTKSVSGWEFLEDVTISLYGPYPEYDELYTASSHENGQTTSLYWQSPITDMVFVSVSGEGGTGDYSFFVQPVNLYDDHANIRGKGTALAVGQEARGELEFHGDVDAFRLDAEEGTVYEVTLDLWKLEDAALHVQDIYGNLVASATAGAGGNKGWASAVWKAETPGFHFIMVRGRQHRHLLPLGQGVAGRPRRFQRDGHGAAGRGVREVPYRHRGGHRLLRVPCRRGRVLPDRVRTGRPDGHCAQPPGQRGRDSVRR